MSYEQYSEPHAQTRFSPHFFVNVTLAEVTNIVRDNLLSGGQYSQVELGQNNSYGYSRDCDVLLILSSARKAYYEEEVNSVCIQFKNNKIVRYRFSKLVLLRGINKHLFNFRLMAKLVTRVEQQNLLSPALIDELKLNRFSEPPHWLYCHPNPAL
ncbi:hypothetical protein R3P38DRAFT_2814146 [Favolaschia claudopus]|uniref:LAGLIDADG homing endonuclease n=1 Tax=Favolaschia claudopus TaxID=2862362 RepID=A0AAV9Z493_9AGAR